MHASDSNSRTPVSGAAPISVGSNSTDQSGFETLMALLGIAHNHLKPHHNLSVKSVEIASSVSTYVLISGITVGTDFLSCSVSICTLCSLSLSHTPLYCTVRWIAWRWHPSVLPRNSSCGADHSYSTTTKSCR